MQLQIRLSVPWPRDEPRPLTPLAAAGRTNMELLEREYQFWRVNRTVDVQKDGRAYTMYRYNVEVGQPRPESYRYVPVHSARPDLGTRTKRTPGLSYWLGCSDLTIVLRLSLTYIRK